MKVCILSTLGGGVGRITSDLVNELHDSNDIEIWLYLLDRRRDYDVACGYNLNIEYFTALNSPLLAKTSSLLRLMVKKFPSDILHCNYVTDAAFLRRAKANMVLTMHGPPRPEIEATLGNKIAYGLEQISLRFLSNDLTAVTISEYSRKIIKRRYGLECKVIYNGIDFKFYQPASNKLELRRNLGLGSGPMILYVGRLHPIKDPMTLIKAFSLVRKEIPNAVLVMVGKGPMTPVVQKYSLREESGIKLINEAFGTNLLKLYQAADVFVLPSIGESFGLVLAEAMACGCPCIGTSEGASRELLGMEQLLIEPSNVDELAFKIIELVQEPAKNKKISDYLRARATSLFDIKEMARAYYNLYKSILN